MSEEKDRKGDLKPRLSEFPSGLLRRFVCALAVFMVLTNTTAQPVLVAPFTRVTNSTIGSESAMSLTGAWGDYDNDGWQDLFVGNWNGTNWLFRNNQNGTFTKVSSGAVVSSASALPFSAAWADYDNDGWLDLIVANHDGVAPHALYRNTGGGSFVKMTAQDIGILASVISRAHTVSWGDYDGDGYLDVFIGNGTAQSSARDFLFHNEGNGPFQAISNNPIVTPMMSSTHGTWSDFDNDGDLDLFVTHVLSQRNSLFRNDRLGQWVEVGATNGLGDIGESGGAAWGDYDNDGDLDLFVTNVRLAGPVTQNFFYRNKGNGTFERITTGELATEQDHFVSCAWVDYDNDGWLDLFLTVTGQVTPAPGAVNNRLYRNQGDGTFMKVTQGSLVTDRGNAGACAWGDYDNDGFPDVFVSFGTIFTSQRSALYRNEGNSNTWIKVRCVGTMCNRSAIGTKVRVLANIGGTNRWQMRQIIGSEGWVTFNSLDVLIGLGNATNINTLRVEWPSGIVREFHNVAVKQSLTVVERTTLAIERPSQGEFNLMLRGPRQQRYRLEASANLTTWLPVASLTITNVDRILSFKYTPGANDPQRFFRAAAE